MEKFFLKLERIARPFLNEAEVQIDDLYRNIFGDAASDLPENRLYRQICKEVLQNPDNMLRKYETGIARLNIPEEITVSIKKVLIKYLNELNYEYDVYTPDVIEDSFCNLYACVLLKSVYLDGIDSHIDLTSELKKLLTDVRAMCREKNRAVRNGCIVAVLLGKESSLLLKSLNKYDLIGEDWKKRTGDYIRKESKSTYNPEQYPEENWIFQAKILAKQEGRMSAVDETYLVRAIVRTNDTGTLKSLRNSIGSYADNSDDWDRIVADSFSKLSVSSFIFQPPAFDSANDFMDELIKISNRLVLHTNPSYHDPKTEEDIFNDYYRDFLINRDYVVKDQTRRPASENGKRAGEADLLVMDGQKEVALIEGLKLTRGFDTAYIKKHIIKAVNTYNPLGTPAFIISYVFSKNFREFWKKYVDYLDQWNDQLFDRNDFPFLKTGDIEPQHHPDAAVRICKTVVRTEGYEFPVFFIAVHITSGN